MSDEILLAKAQSIERCVARIRQEYHGHEAEFATNFTRQDSIVLNLQRACEALIDMANRTIKLGRLGYPKESADAFRLLAERSILTQAQLDAMTGMVGFRNVAVPQYRDLDLAIVRQVVEHHLDDLLEVAKALIRAPSD